MQSTLSFSQPDPLQQIIDTLRGELLGLFQVRTVGTKARGRIISFGGRLLHEPDVTFDEISRRFLAHGYTPMLRREKGEDVVVAMEGIVDAKTGNPLLNLLLFLATIVTTLIAGAYWFRWEQLITDILNISTVADALPFIVQVFLDGWPFTLALLAILGCHELGHYIAARLHGVRATLPYFIPFIGLGTLGAFISIKSPMKDRKVLFDIGLAGPVAGFIVALPLMVIGLLLSTETVPIWVNEQTLYNMGSSILSDFIVDLFTDIPAGRTLVVHPVFFAAWLGFYLTAINLLPVGQLDGGHVTYALLGRMAHLVAVLTFLGLLIAGHLLHPNWYIWAFFTFISGLRHPPPLNDLSGIGLLRIIIGLITIIVFILIIIPVPKLALY